MLRFLLAPDSLKGSLTAAAACHAMERGVRAACITPAGSTNDRDIEVVLVPLADGGEGTVDALVLGCGGTYCEERVSGPLGEHVTAKWGRGAGLALLEMAQASGLTLVAPGDRDAPRASSYGTGQLIRAALEAGETDILLGIGGSATTDGGVGALRALGVRFLDSDGEELLPGGGDLARLHSIDKSGLHPALTSVRLRVLCDVTNPLCGPLGTAAIYGPQKGASPAEVLALDSALDQYAALVAAFVGGDYSDTPGAGAAGGMGFGLLAFAGAELVPGIETVLQVVGFKDLLETADLVLTAEGSIDEQTLHGKAVAGIGAAARAARGGRGVPVIAFAGAVDLSGDRLAELGVSAAIPLPNRPMSLDACMMAADDLVAGATERAVRLWLCGRVTA